MGDAIYAVSAQGSDVVTVADSFKEIKLPPGVGCDNALIQVRDTTSETFDIDTDLKAFEFSNTNTGPGYLYDKDGMVLGEKRSAGERLGYIKAPVGCKVVVRTVT